MACMGTGWYLFGGLLSVCLYYLRASGMKVHIAAGLEELSLITKCRDILLGQ
uniref:Uncharacterized protein n=1 Tax=Rhodnius prolixus TaxID=13249 RepID=T1HKS7_RHOPR